MDCDTGDYGPWQPAACVPCVELVVDQALDQAQVNSGKMAQVESQCKTAEEGTRGSKALVRR